MKVVARCDRVLLLDAVPPCAGTIIERAHPLHDGDWLVSRDECDGDSVARYESELTRLEPAPADNPRGE